jgi:mono/diheme cytochrome c family protein
MILNRIIVFVPFLFLLIAGGYSGSAYAQGALSPTPTYDPLSEPIVPDNPSEYDLGRNWYWHNCMTCHGDVGQGLTDEFRAIWPEDHQNCWAHGCHGGHNGDEGFPIPTVVPPLVNESKLVRFTSQQAFYEYLKSTHPPQDPGGLTDEEYQAIVKFVFSLNDRSLDEITPTSTPELISTFTPIQEDIPAEEHNPQSNVFVYIGLGILTIFVTIWVVRKLRSL